MTNYDAMAEKIALEFCDYPHPHHDNPCGLMREIATALREVASSQEQWLCDRLIEALKQKKPAVTAFTEGPLRQVMYAVEERVREAVEESKKYGSFTAKQMDTAINKAWAAAREEARSEALEEAAKVIEDHYWDSVGQDLRFQKHIKSLAEKIRALREAK